MKFLSSILTRPFVTRLLVLLGVFFCTIGSDQLTKYGARNLLAVSGQTSFLGGLVKFSLVENYGGFLGIVSNLPSGLRFFLLNVCVAILLAACLGYLLWSSKQQSQAWIPVAFITGGGISNLLDRLVGTGGVTDFVIVGTDFLHTGIFNLADVFILVGSFVLGFHLFRHSSPQ